MNEQYSDEIDLKQLGRKILSITRGNRNLFRNSFILITLISTLFFLKVVFMPTFKATYIVKSKHVKFDQITNIVDQYNYNIDDSELNPLPSQIANSIQNLNLKSVDLTEIKNEDDILKKDDEVKFKIYNIVFLYKNKTSYASFETINKLFLTHIQESCSKDNQVIETRVKLQNGIKEIDTLIKVAYSAGNGYSNTIAHGSNSSQLMVMNDLYTGINGLISQKLNYEQDLALLELKNLIFQSTPVVVSNKIEYPWAIFALGFGIWILASFFIVIFKLVFGEND